MSYRHEWMVGLQSYAYDVNDEGAEAVLEAAGLTSANVVFVAVSYGDLITTQDPARAPRLTHNPVRERHVNQAFVRPSPGRYPAGLVPPVGTDPALDGETAYRSLRAAAAPLGVTVVPWLLALSQPVATQAPQHAVVNARGDIVPGWLCPSQPATLEFVEALVADIVARFEPPAVFVDGARFPEPRAGRVADGAGCFCDACYAAAEEAGLDLGAARAELTHLLDEIEQDPLEFARRVSDACASGFRVLKAAAAGGAVLSWLRFRQEAIEHVVTAASRAMDGRSELWLDVWPPTYGWLLGQDVARLAPYARWTRPFTYHRWGGGADIPGLIGSLSGDERTQQALYNAFRSFFRFPGPETYGEFRQRGLDASFITKETAFLVELLGGRSRPVAGLQIWQVGRKGVHEALESAIAAGPDGVILHCFGWATREELKAAGDWLRQRGRAGNSAADAAVRIVE